MRPPGKWGGLCCRLQTHEASMGSTGLLWLAALHKLCHTPPWLWSRPRVALGPGERRVSREKRAAARVPWVLGKGSVSLVRCFPRRGMELELTPQTPLRSPRNLVGTLAVRMRARTSRFAKMSLRPVLAATVTLHYT